MFIPALVVEYAKYWSFARMTCGSGKFRPITGLVNQSPAMDGGASEGVAEGVAGGVADGDARALVEVAVAAAGEGVLAEVAPGV